MRRACNKCGVEKSLEEFARHKKGRHGRRTYCKACGSAAEKARRETDPQRARALSREYYNANREAILAREKERRDTDSAYAEVNRRRAREWARANPERNSERALKWAKANPERARELARRARAANPERYNALARAWAERNPEKRRAIVKAYSDRNRDALRIKGREYARTRDRGVVNAQQRAWKAANRDKVAAGNHARRADAYTEDARAYVRILHGDPCSYCGTRLEKPHIDHVVPISAGGDNQWDNLTASCVSCNSSKHAAPLLGFLHRQALALNADVRVAA